MSGLVGENSVPENILQWLQSQGVDDRLDAMEGVLKDYVAQFNSGLFLSEGEINNISVDIIDEEFRKGGYRKILSKKMRARLDGKVIHKHVPLRQTAVFLKLESINSKRMGYKYIVANYFQTPGGYVYVIRNGERKPSILIFTGHFFDRFLERSLKTTDHAARMTGVARLLRSLKRKTSSDDVSVGYFHKTNRAFLAVLGGLALGIGGVYKALPPQFDFLQGKTYGYEEEDLELLETIPRQVYMFFTYVEEKMLGEEQLYLYNRLTASQETSSASL